MSSEKYYEGSEEIKYVTYNKVTEGDKMLFDGVLYREVYIYNPPVPEGMPSYEVKVPRVDGWPDQHHRLGEPSLNVIAAEVILGGNHDTA